MGKVFNMVGGGGNSQDLPLGSRINVTSDLGVSVEVSKGSLHYYDTVYSRIPSAYQEVEYIQSTGTQYINLGITSDAFKFKTSINFSDTSSQYFFGTLSAGSGSPQRNYIIGYTQKWNIGGTTDVLSADSFATNTWYELEAQTINPAYIKVNGNIVVTSNQTHVNGNLYLFAVYNIQSSAIFDKGARCKIKQFEIYDSNNSLIRNLIPCYRISDSVIGMYDTVNDVFYTNAGSGTFTKGADITQGTVTFTVNYSGTWQLSASKTGEETLTDTVSVLADDTDYNTTMEWGDGHLFKDGEQYADKTGGWFQNTSYILNSGGSGTGTVTIGTTITANAGGGCNSVAATRNKVDLSGYTSLKVKVTGCTDSYPISAMALTAGNITTQCVSVLNTGGTGTKVFDISSITEPVYIAFGAYNGRYVTVSEIWLE